MTRISWQAKLLHFVANIVSTTLNFFSDFNIPRHRYFIERAIRLLRRNKNIITESLIINHITAEWIYTVPTSKIILYIHGGAFLIGSTNTHCRLMTTLAHLTSHKILGINYRLAPEHPFPAAVEDSFMAYQWLIDRGINAKNIIIAGDSAGGNLAIATAILARDQGLELPSAIICLSPWLDLSLSGASVIANAKKDTVVKPKLAHIAAQYYLQGKTAADSPLASPLFANLTNLPPIYIQVSDAEMLYADTLRFADMARLAGVNVHIKIYHQLMHSWHLAAPWLPEAKYALEDAANFIKKISQ